MANIIMLYIGAIMTLIWGVAHLFAIKGAIKDFGEISEDNKNIFTMEWMVEGFTLIFIGLLTLVLTIAGEFTNPITIMVFWMCILMLLALAVLSLFTGFKVSFPAYKLCPIIFTTSGILIIFGML